MFNVYELQYFTGNDFIAITHIVRTENGQEYTYFKTVLHPSETLKKYVYNNGISHFSDTMNYPIFTVRKSK